MEIHPGHAFAGFRRTDKDRKPPRRVLTARLLGDPAPDRRVPQIPEETRAGLLPDPAPIFLTFREYRAYYGDPETDAR